MRAAYITGREDLAVREVPAPDPGPGQVRLRVDYVGICGSDLHYYFQGANGASAVREPLIPGHELSGRVDLDPEGRWEAGTPVTVHPARFGDRSERFADSPHVWPGGSYLGSAATFPHTQGALSEFLIVEHGMVRALPEGLTVRDAVLAEPLAVSMHAVARAGDVRGQRVLVTGSGPIGLLTIAAARVAGAESVAATDVRSGPLRRARDVGADVVYDVAGQQVPPDSFDVVFECTGVPASVSGALAAARPAGTVVLVGMMPGGEQQVVLAPLAAKELTVVGSLRFSDEIDAAVRLLAQRPEIAQVITHEFPADRVLDAFDAAADSDSSGKVIVSVWS